VRLLFCLILPILLFTMLCLGNYLVVSLKPSQAISISYIFQTFLQACRCYEFHLLYVIVELLLLFLWDYEPLRLIQIANRVKISARLEEIAHLFVYLLGLNV